MSDGNHRRETLHPVSLAAVRKWMEGLAIRNFSAVRKIFFAGEWRAYLRKQNIFLRSTNSAVEVYKSRREGQQIQEGESTCTVRKVITITLTLTKTYTHSDGDGGGRKFLLYILIYIIIFHERWERPRRVCAKTVSVSVIVSSDGGWGC